MGLFDRFRKKIKQADEDYGITVEDGSTPTPRGRTGKQSGNEPENQQRDEAELDFYDSGPESPMRRLLATAPSASGTSISDARDRLGGLAASPDVK